MQRELRKYENQQVFGQVPNKQINDKLPEIVRAYPYP